MLRRVWDWLSVDVTITIITLAMISIITLAMIIMIAVVWLQNNQSRSYCNWADNNLATFFTINKFWKSLWSCFSQISCHFIQKQSGKICSPRGVLEKDVLKNFVKFIEKHLCQSLFCDKVAGLRPATLLKETLVQLFSCGFFEISKNTFSYRTSPVTAFFICEPGWFLFLHN